MPRQLTPDELKIIRDTEEEGAILAEREKCEDGVKKNKGRWIIGLLLLAAIFIVFVFIAFLIVGTTAGK